MTLHQQPTVSLHASSVKDHIEGTNKLLTLVFSGESNYNNSVITVELQGVLSYIKEPSLLHVGVISLFMEYILYIIGSILSDKSSYSEDFLEGIGLTYSQANNYFSQSFSDTSTLSAAIRVLFSMAIEVPICAIFEFQEILKIPEINAPENTTTH